MIMGMISLEKTTKDICLREIACQDIENLRLWKNSNKKSFFSKKTISRTKQKKWFEEYSARTDDFMFIIEYKKNPVGCIGFRLLPDGIDLYNLILIPEEQKKGIMSKVLKLIIRHKIKKNYRGHPIKVSVLKSNTALNWYLKNNFQIKEEFPEYYSLIYEK